MVVNKNDSKKQRSKKGLINPDKTKTFIVHHETTLLNFLREKIPNQSQHNIRSMIAKQQVAVGGAPVTLFVAPLYPDDEVTVSYNRISRRNPKDLPIIYEDDDIIAIDKPSGLLSVASDREKGRTAYRLVSDYVTSRDRNKRIFVVHRLDEDTSGVLIFAKNYKTKEALQNAWGSIVSVRAYYAVVEGEDIPDEGNLRNYLAQDDNTFLVYVTKNREKGKLCLTNYKKIASKNGLSILDVHIDSGRKNQIRVQLGNIGHHVIGDDKYGEPVNPIGRLGLHAYELKFTNPSNGKEYDLTSPMPDSFKKLFWKTHKEIKEEALEKARRKENGRRSRR